MAEVDQQPAQQIFQGASKDAPLSGLPVTHTSQFLDSTSLDSPALSPTISPELPYTSDVETGSLFASQEFDNGDHPFKLRYKQYIFKGVAILTVGSILFGGIVFAIIQNSVQQKEGSIVIQVNQLGDMPDQPTLPSGKTLSVSVDANFQKDIDVQGDLAVKGVSVFGSSISVMGLATINGDLVVTGNIKAANFPGGAATQGPRGLAGLDGANGTSGADGANGANGTSGADGNSCGTGVCISLQGSSPGVQEAGSLNVSGTVMSSTAKFSSLVSCDSVDSDALGNLVCGIDLGAANSFVQGGNSFGAIATMGTNDAFDLAFETNGSERVRIDTNGNVGIGTSTPAGKLHVQGMDDTSDIVLFSAGSDTGVAGVPSMTLQVRAGASQAANLFEAQSSSGVAMASIGATGATIFKNTTNSTTAFQIQDSAGLVILNANTSQGRLEVGTFSPIITWSTAPVTRTDYTTGTAPRSITSADFNGDGKDDLAVANYDSANVSVLINTGTGTFATKVDYTTGSSPYDVTSADFNGDGKADLAVANSASNTISILMNTGTGIFTAKVDYSTGTSPKSVTSADFNGDGKADLAVANSASNTISVFINNGDGTFAAKVDYAISSSPIAVTSADFNGDGKADLAVAAGSMVVLMNTGTGTFSAPVGFGFTYPKSVTSADFNGDGKADLAAGGNSTIFVYMGTGTGTFSAATFYDSGDANVGRVISKDMNGDNKPDLINNAMFASNVTVLINAGTGTFGSVAHYTTAGYSELGLVAADFNGDSKTDLAAGASSSSKVSVLIFGVMTSTATVQTPSKFVINSGGSLVSQLIQSNPGQTGDLLQLQNSLNTVLFSVGVTGNTVIAGTLGVTGAVTASSTLNVSSTFTANGSSVFKKTANSTTSFSVQQADGTSILNIDSTNARVGISNAAPGNKLSINTLTTADSLAQIAVSTGATTNKGLIVQGVASQTANLFEAQSSSGAVMASIGATGAVNLKNNTDSSTAFRIQDSAGALVLAADTIQKTLSVGEFVGTPQYAPPVKNDYVVYNEPAQPVSADFNGDGKMDIATSSNGNTGKVAVLLNTGTGTFGPPTYYNVYNQSNYITSADFNGDGRPDIAVANSSANMLSVLLNTGTGTFGAPVDYPTGTLPSSITSADFNGDSRPDIAVSNKNSNTLSVFINTGTGTFAAKIDYTTGTSPQSVTTADFNGDGKADLAVTNQSSNTVSVFINTGTGTFAAKVDYSSPNNPVSITTADFNGDGSPDIAVVNFNGSSISVFINTGTGTFAAKVDYSSAGVPNSITSADFNGDGSPDIAVGYSKGNTSPGVASLFLNNGNGTFAPKTDYSTNTGTDGITASDVNGDGVFELVVASPSAARVSVIFFSWSIVPSARLTVNAGSTRIGQIIKGATGQTSDLLQIQDVTHNMLFSVGATGNITATGNISAYGSALFKNTVNSTTAFRVQQANGSAIFNIDTVNARVGIWNESPGNKLSINTLTTADSLAQIAVSTGATTNKGLIVQGVASQTADLQQWQDSAGTVLARVDASGNGFFNNGGGGTGAAFVQGGNSFGAIANLGTNDNFDLNLKTNGTAKLTVLANGNVGIDTTAPGAKLHVQGSDDASNTVLFAAGSDTIAAGIPSMTLQVKAGSGQTTNLQEWHGSGGVPFAYIKNTGAAYFPIGTAINQASSGQTGLTVGANGDGGTLPLLVVGGASQTADLQQWQDSAGTVLARVDASGNGFFNNGGGGTGAAFVQGGNSFGATAILGTNDAFDLQLETGGTTKLTVQNSTGNVGIGASNPNAKLEINQTAAASILDLKYNGNSVLTVESNGIVNQQFTNLAINGGFEAWGNGATAVPSGWQDPGSVTYAKETTIVKDGLASMKLTWDSFFPQVGNTIAPAQAMGKTLTMSAWVYDPDASSAANPSIRVDYFDGVTYYPATATHSNTTNGWELLTVSIQIPATGITAVRYRVTMTGTGSAYFDSVMVTLGKGPLVLTATDKPLSDYGLISQLASGYVGINTTTPGTSLAVNGGNNINPSFPDGLIGTSITQTVTDASTYTVPSGKNLYITNALSENTPSAGLQLDGKSIYYGKYAGITQYNTDIGGDSLSQPIIAGPGTVVKCSSACTYVFNGILVDAAVTAKIQTVTDVATYTVPTGKTFYILNVAETNPLNFTKLMINGKAVRYAGANGRHTTGTGASPIGQPIIATAGDILSAESTRSIELNGYLTKSSGFGGADLAERYFASETVEPGDVVSVASSSNADKPTVKKSGGQYDPQVLGIVTTQPNQVYTTDQTRSLKSGIADVALAGRVPVKVSGENGPIKLGDSLTPSSIPGVAMKATQPGRIIGTALETSDCGSKDCVGKVLTFVHIGTYIPNNKPSLAKYIQPAALTAIGVYLAIDRIKKHTRKNPRKAYRKV